MIQIVEWVKEHRWQSMLIGLAIAVLLGLGGYFGYRLFKARVSIERTDTKVVTKSPEPQKPLTKASLLTGIEVAPELADRHITAVVIENHPDARPQSGLGEASIVYEALAEGGITRFLAFFLDTRPPQLGPVRSLRTYFVDWALEFDAPVAHVGGNIDALDLVVSLGMKDMNEFSYGSSFYRAKDRYAPHNAYTSSDLLDKLAVALGYNKPATFTPNPRKKDAPPAAGSAAAHPTIGINYSYNGYQVEYRYDPARNDYARFMAGSPHIDRNTNQQIRVKNIVVEYMPTSYGRTRIGEQAVIMATPGSGKAVVFRDGGAIEGTWSKSNHRSRTKLLDVSGAEIPLNTGNTWFSIVPVGRTISY